MLHGVRRLRAFLDPLRSLVGRDLDRRRIGQRVVMPDDFDEAAVARRARIGHDHAVGWLSGGPRPSQSDVYRHRLTSFVWLSGQARHRAKPVIEEETAWRP